MWGVMWKPGGVAELDANSLLHAPLRGEDEEALLLVVHERATQPRVASVHLVQPGRVQALVKHHVIVRQLEAHKPAGDLLPEGEGSESTG